MMKPPFTAIGFDLDGTLVDSCLDLAPAVNYGLELAGRPAVTEDETRRFIGGGVRLMLERALDYTGGPIDPAEFETITSKVLAYYADHIADNTVVYDGCLAALDELLKRGAKLAVCTNKAEGLAVDLIAKLGIAHYFTCVLGGDSLGRDRAKPAPDMILAAARLCGAEGNFAMVGDSSFDTRAARSAGAPSVLLSFGYNDGPADQLGGDIVIDHFDELVSALDKLAATSAS